MATRTRMIIVLFTAVGQGPLLTSPSPHAGPAASASAKAAAAAAASSNVLYPSYRYNAKNFWLEYSTPPSTQFPDYDEDYYQSTSTERPGPSFLHGSSVNQTVRQVPLGSTVYLDCRVKELQDYQVSWFRRDGARLDILTVGRDSFSLDARYSVALERPNNWRLRVRPTLRSDNGSYLCQVSTHPPIILVTHLKIIVPEVYLIDDEDGRVISEKHYKPGSTIELRCVVKNFLPEFSSSVVWRKEGRRISQEDSRRGGGVSIKTKQANDTVTSHLYLATAAAADSGKYTCAVGKLARAKLSLHILNGEEPAAIQSSRAGKGGRGDKDILLAFAVAVFFPMLVPHFEV